MDYTIIKRGDSLKLVGNKLTPSPGYKIYSQQSDTLHDVVYLGKYDSINNYVEMKDPNAALDDDVVSASLLVDIANNIINN
jgi:hypothetical protein